MLDRLYIDVTVKLYCLCNVPYDRTAEDTLDNARKNADTRPYKTNCLDQKTSCINCRKKPAALKCKMVDTDGACYCAADGTSLLLRKNSAVIPVRLLLSIFNEFCPAFSYTDIYDDHAD